SVSGCHHRESAMQTAPLPQELPPPVQPAPPVAKAPAPATIPVTPVPPGGVSAEDLDYVATHKPIATETGLATWYTAYKGRHSANGQVFDDGAMTAAHRTLPMGSLVVVTNLTTGQSGVMRITDRGPFVEGRILDLTMAAAKVTGVYRAGLVRVRMDVYETPKPMDVGGRWCVQIGAFHNEEDALSLKQQLQREYPGSNVIEFAGETTYWVRIRPVGDDRVTAEYIAQHLQPVEGDAFLTRLD
ncbi:MAG: septal ring lytic transglycosylase RlpA family protein, partial [Terracidiphilus sp.]